jgi:hypothetical protein
MILTFYYSDIKVRLPFSLEEIIVAGSLYLVPDPFVMPLEPQTCFICTKIFVIQCNMNSGNGNPDAIAYPCLSGIFKKAIVRSIIGRNH